MIYLLTPTGGRSEAFALLTGYINTQTYNGSTHWIVVDDCEPETPMPERMPWHQRIQAVKPNWCWQPGQNTQAACLAVGLQLVPDDATLLIIEDDDVYLPRHVENMVKALEQHELVGERDSRYYNVATRRYRTIPGSHHASLCSTGVRGRALAALRNLVQRPVSGIDFKLWRGFKGKKVLLDSHNVVGIKGLPGRAGIGVGHRDNFGTPDASGVLEEWIGAHRAARYKLLRVAA